MSISVQRRTEREGQREYISYPVEGQGEDIYYPVGVLPYIACIGHYLPLCQGRTPL